MPLLQRIFLLSLALLILPGLACAGINLGNVPTQQPQPTELAGAPLPEGSQLGGLEGIFASAASISGGQGSRCFKLYRFYPDGTALYADLSCFDEGAITASLAEIEGWLKPGNPGVSQGDYATQDSLIWSRIVVYDSITGAVSLRSFQGEVCGTKMVLQEPGVLAYSGVPSDLTQPVLEYIALRTNLAGGSESGCRAAGFRFDWRPSVAIAGGQVEYRIQTDPGEVCSLQYAAPDGTDEQPAGTGEVTADTQGFCYWICEVGETSGDATVTIQIDEIRQDLLLELR
jgi:hypothetical protein